MRIAASDSGIVDVQLVENVYRQAAPSIAVGAGGRRLVTWTHDRPDLASLSAGELAFSTSTGAGQPWTTGGQATTDDRDDYNRQVVFLQDGSALAVWERFDTSTPGDLTSDSAGYLSHTQVAAARWTSVVARSSHSEAATDASDAAATTTGSRTLRTRAVSPRGCPAVPGLRSPVGGTRRGTGCGTGLPVGRVAGTASVGLVPQTAADTHQMTTR